jgi:hypothetical protein
LPRIWAIDEYVWDSKVKQKQKSDNEYADDFVLFCQDHKLKMIDIYMDPSAASLKIAIRNACFTAGIYANFKETDNDVVNGIKCQARLLKLGQYAISSRCKHTIKDYFGYVWDARAQLRGEDAPLKTGGADHTKDAERYPLQSKFGDAEKLDLRQLSRLRK